MKHSKPKGLDYPKKANSVIISPWCPHKLKIPFLPFTISLRCKGQMTAVWSVRCQPRRRATSMMISSSLSCARCQEELHSLIGKRFGKFMLFWLLYCHKRELISMMRVYFFVRGYYVRWKAVDHCVKQFLHATKSCSRRQVGRNVLVLCMCVLLTVLKMNNLIIPSS